MKKKLILLAAFLLVANLANSQAIATSKLIWDQPGTISIPEATAFTYKYYPDNAVAGIVLTNVTCSGTSTITCQANFPAFTPGAHTLTISSSNAAGESAKSSPFAFVFVVTPGTPFNIRIQ